MVIALSSVSSSCNTFDILRYLLETQTSCLLSKGEPIPVGEVILKMFLTLLYPFST